MIHDLYQQVSCPNFEKYIHFITRTERGQFSPSLQSTFSKSELLELKKSVLHVQVFSNPNIYTYLNCPNVSSDWLFDPDTRGTPQGRQIRLIQHMSL